MDPFNTLNYKNFIHKRHWHGACESNLAPSFDGDRHA